MKLVDMTCPYCGAVLKVDADQKQATCEYCGKTFLIDDEVRHIEYDNAEQAGYEFEKGRQRAQREAARNRQVQQDRRQLKQTKKSGSCLGGLLFIIGCLIIFPIPITFITLRSKHLGKGAKIFVIISMWIIWIVLIAAYNTGKSSSSKTTESISGSSVTESTDINTQLDDFVRKFNDASDEDLVYTGSFRPSDENSSHYRTEFRLSAYANAVGKSYKFGSATVDLIGRKDYGDSFIMRIYMTGADLSATENMIRTAGPLMDPGVTQADIQGAVNYIEENGEANGYDFGDLTVLVLPNEFMLKMGTD